MLRNAIKFLTTPGRGLVIRIKRYLAVELWSEAVLSKQSKRPWEPI